MINSFLTGSEGCPGDYDIIMLHRFRVLNLRGNVERSYSPRVFAKSFNVETRKSEKR